MWLVSKVSFLNLLSVYTRKSGNEGVRANLSRPTVSNNQIIIFTTQEIIQQFYFGWNYLTCDYWSKSGYSWKNCFRWSTLLKSLSEVDVKIIVRCTRKKPDGRCSKILGNISIGRWKIVCSYHRWQNLSKPLGTWGKTIWKTQYLLQGVTVNPDRYCQILIKLCLTIKRKRSGLLCGKVLLCHNNARPHFPQWTKDLLKYFQLEVFDHPPYYPDLAPSDYTCFFSWWKS